MYRLLFLIILACLSIQTLAISISSVKISETADANGYYGVSVSGTDFGPGPNIVLFDDFNSQVSGAPIVLNKSALIGTWINSSSYTAVPKIVDYGKGKAFQIYGGSSKNGPSVAQIETVFSPKVSNVFVSYSVVVPEGKFFSGSSVDYQFPDVSSWKFIWITDGPDAIASRTKYNVCAPTHGGKGTFLLAGNSVNYGWISLSNSWSWHSKNYMSFGMLPSISNPQTEPGKLFFQMTGKPNASYIYNNSTKPIFPDTNTTSFDRVKFPGWFGNGDSSNFDAYYDDVYVASGENAFARIEISDAATVPKSTLNLTMPVSSWSNEQIEFKIHKEHLYNISNSGMFVRAYDKNNNTTSAPIICAKCPKPPIGL